MENGEKFNYTYSTKEQEEIKKIRERYAPRDTRLDKMEQLRRLDAGVTRKGTVVSLVMGAAGALVMGTGMSLVMTDIGTRLGGLAGLAGPIGIALGVVGLVPVALAYPVYSRITQKERERIAPEILRLTDELMK